MAIQLRGPERVERRAGRDRSPAGPGGGHGGQWQLAEPESLKLPSAEAANRQL
ncbi:MAG: hypothetical protein QOK29_5513 [Rhodospirillaceae bacterium]|nr:hypothetical protein [Miltoncostaeaceae bacterium]MEA2783881.1 hypothetical protein [Rhodospirillaceae bacterium]